MYTSDVTLSVVLVLSKLSLTYDRTLQTRSSAKIESDTVSKLSYQAWSVGPKEKVPWGRKGEYQRPADRMSADTIYHMSYPAPGRYEECIPEECNCS